MLFIYKKLRFRRGNVGKLARWVADTYIDSKRKYPTESERSIRIRIAEARYPNKAFDPSFEADNVDIFFTNRILASNDLHEIVIAFVKREIGIDYQSNKDDLVLIYAVIYEELTEKGIPSEVAMSGSSQYI